MSRRRQKHFSFGTRRGDPEVNESMPLPTNDGIPWVDEDRCVCMAHPGTYKDYNSKVTFAEAADYVRQWNADNDITDGGWRSRGPVLHAMRVIKLERWYEAHGGCNIEIPKDPDDWPPMVWEMYEAAEDTGYEGSPQDFADLNDDDDDELHQAAAALVDPDEYDDEAYDDDDAEYDEDLF